MSDPSRAVPGPTPTDEPTDEQLLARHGAGDPEAFGELVHRHRDRLWAVALRTLGDREDAADAVQDALVSAFRASATPGAFRGDAAVTTWLHRIVVNACIDRARRRAARPTVPLPDDGALPAAADQLAPREAELVVHDALRQLPAEQAAAIALVDLQGYPVAEAARILDVAPGTVKSRCSRGRARLLQLLGGDAERNPQRNPQRNPEGPTHVPPERTPTAAPRSTP